MPVLRDAVTAQCRLSAEPGRVLSDRDVREQPGKEEEEEITWPPLRLYY